MDKVPKKLRPFFDGTLKWKHRLAALILFIESSTESEQALVYKEYSEALVSFIIESHNGVLEKLNVDKEFNGKLERSLNRGTDEFYKIPFLLDRVLRYLRVELPSMSQVDQLINIIRTLLHPANHPTLRKEGIRLLLLWMRDESSIMPETITLFSSCIQLSPFTTNDNIILTQPSFPLSLSNEPPMFPAPNLPSEKELSLMTLKIMLDNITFDPDADRKSTLVLYRLFRQHYLVYLYPEACKRLGIFDKDSNVGFIAGCPDEIQAILMSYFAMWIVQSPELFSNSSTIPVATFILQEILLNSPDDLELIHEIIGQSLQLPYSYTPVIKIAIGMMRAWIFNTKERRPVFLQCSPNSKTTLHLVDTLCISPSEVFDFYLQKYMDSILGLFDCRASVGYLQEQTELYREGIYFLRGTTMKAFFQMDKSSWEHLLDVLFKLTDSHLTPSNKYCVISDPDTAEEFARLLVETLFGVLIRSETMSPKYWEGIQSILGRSTAWLPVVDEWSKVATELTNIMAEYVFNYKPHSVEHLPQAQTPDQGSSSIKRRNLRSGVFEGEMISFIPSSSNLIGRAIATELSLTLSSGHGNANFLQFPQGIDRKSDSFLAWNELAWTRENVVFLWRNILRTLGDINKISRADIHEVATLCLVQIFEKLLSIRESQPYFCRPLPPLYEFAVVLLDVCDLSSRVFERSRCLAYSAICRMFCRKLDMSFPEAYFTRFYLALINGLVDKDDSVATIILLNSSYIFSRQLPGSLVMIPVFLKLLAALLNNQLSNDRAAILVPMMRIAGNSGTIPGVLPGLKPPRIEAPLPVMSTVPMAIVGSMDWSSIKTQVKDLLSMLDHQEIVKKDPNIHSVLMSVITVLLTNELLAFKDGNLNDSLIDSYLNVLLDHLSSKTTFCIPGLVDQIYALAHVRSLVGHFGIEREVLIIQRLILATHTATTEEDGMEYIASRMIMTILEWIMVLPSDWLNSQISLREQLFQLFEKVLQRYNNTKNLGDRPSSMITSSPKRPGTRTTTPASNSAQSLPLSGNQELSGDEDYDVSSASSPIKEAVEFAIIHLQHYLDNFSPEFGPTMISSQVPEPHWQNDRVVYFSIGNSTILAIQQLSADQSAGESRIIARNVAGRFTWDIHSFYETFQHRQSPKISALEKQLVLMSAKKVMKMDPFIPPPGQIKSLFTRGWKEIPQFIDGKVDLEATDMLSELLDYIEEEYPEGTQLKAINNFPPERKANIDKVAEYCAEQMECERIISGKYVVGSSDLQSTEFKHPKSFPAIPDIKNVSPFHHCRQFLASLSFLQTPLEDSFKVNIKVLTKTNAFKRDLKGLDQKFSRETIKVALLFVAPDQEDEVSILRNDPSVTSSGYEEFLHGLGWRVDLREHVGYTGGLEPGRTINDQALYHATSLTEIIFHDSTTILTDPQDVKFVNKKRHIGNDYVHIVWNEHYRDYRPTTIRGDFGLVQVIITPCPSLKLYRISIFRDASVAPFGPLFDGALIPRSLLAPLIRATAVCAHRAVLTALAKPHYPRHPMSGRSKDISLIVKRHAQSTWTTEQFLGYVIFGNNPQLEEVRSNDLSESIDKLQIKRE